MNTTSGKMHLAQPRSDAMLILPGRAEWMRSGELSLPFTVIALKA